jgi:hypothetical protein
MLVSFEGATGDGWNRVAVERFARLDNQISVEGRRIGWQFTEGLAAGSWPIEAVRPVSVGVSEWVVNRVTGEVGRVDECSTHVAGVTVNQANGAMRRALWSIRDMDVVASSRGYET